MEKGDYCERPTVLSEEKNIALLLYHWADYNLNNKYRNTGFNRAFSPVWGLKVIPKKETKEQQFPLQPLCKTCGPLSQTQPTSLIFRVATYAAVICKKTVLLSKKREGITNRGGGGGGTVWHNIVIF